MLRRQALGTLNQNGTTTMAASAPCLLKPVNGASAAAASSLKCFDVNNENQPPTEAATKATEFDFSLFKEEFGEFKQKLAEAAEEKIDDKNEEEEEEEDYEEVDEEEEESEEEEEESEDEEEEDDDDEKAEEFRDQFQDISRLNLGENEKTDIMNNVMIQETFSTSRNTSSQVCVPY